MIELRHLRYLLAVAEEGHMTRAAARLGIQQPPLSQQIKALEGMVGTPLFRRLPRGVEPTAAGLVLAEKARLILADVDRALDAARRTARGEEGRLALGFTSSAAFHALVAALVRSMREAAPNLSLSLEEASTLELIAALRDGRLDAAFVRAPVARPDGLVIAHVLDEEMLVALPDHHRLAAPALRRRALELAALAEETFILYRRPSGPGLYDSIIAACQQAGFSPRVGQEAPRLASTLSLVAAGLGLSIVPASMARLETNGIVYRRLAPPIRLFAPLSLAYRDEVPEGPLAALLRLVESHRA